MITLLSLPDVEPARRASIVRAKLPVVPWAMLRVRNQHSQAFRGLYDPETSPWGVEIMESQYWPRVRSVDVVGSPQIGKSHSTVEVPTLYDLCEGNETVFYMNGSADNALNLWTTRWEKTIGADQVLRQQLLDRMEAGRWMERHLRDGGLLYSAGPESVAALAQREARIVRVSELEKTKGALGADGREASSYAQARDRAGAYPTSHIITSDCTVTVREGISWVRFRQGDRSRPFVPCPGCGRYAMPAHERHIEEPDLALTIDDVHILKIAPLSASTPVAAGEQAALTCVACGYVFSNADFRRALRAVVWVPVGCRVIRHDDAKLTPIPNVSWLDDLRKWAALQLSNADVVDGSRDPDPPPAWSGPRLPDGVELDWTPESPVPGEEETLTGLRSDPRKSPNRSFWVWRIFSPKWTIGQVAEEIVAGDIGAATGDIIDDQKNCTQKCLVLPWVERVIGEADDLTERVVLMSVSDLPRGRAPENTIAITGGIDVNEDAVRAVKRAWTSDGETFLIDHRVEWTGLVQYKREHGRNEKDARFIRTREEAVIAAIDRVWTWLSDTAEIAVGSDVLRWMTYLDSGFMSDEVYAWCRSKSFDRLRPCKGFGTVGITGARRKGQLSGYWNDTCEKKASECRDKRGRPLRHQYYDENDPRRLMRLEADHWKKEVHGAIKLWSLHAKAMAMKSEDAVTPPWFFVHTGFKITDDYVKQVVGERWEEREDPRTGKREVGWKEYSAEWHFLDAEAYAFAAAAMLGVDFGRRGQNLNSKKRKGQFGVVGKAF